MEFKLFKSNLGIFANARNTVKYLSPSFTSKALCCMKPVFISANRNEGHWILVLRRGYRDVRDLVDVAVEDRRPILLSKIEVWGMFPPWKGVRNSRLSIAIQSLCLGEWKG